MNMKRLITFFLPLILVSVIALTPSCALVKGKSPDTAVVNVSDAAKVSVETALRAWNDWIPVGKPSLDQQRKVKDAYLKYKGAQLLLLDSALLYNSAKEARSETPEQEAAMNSAAAAASAALGDVIGLIRQFGVKI